MVNYLNIDPKELWFFIYFDTNITFKTYSRKLSFLCLCLLLLYFLGEIKVQKCSHCMEIWFLIFFQWSPLLFHTDWLWDRIWWANKELWLWLLNYFPLSLILSALLLTPIRWLWSDWDPYCSWLAEEVNPWCRILFSYRERYSLHKLWLFDRSSLPPDTFDFCSGCCLTIWNI